MSGGEEQKYSKDRDGTVSNTSDKEGTWWHWMQQEKVAHATADKLARAILDVYKGVDGFK